LLYPVRRKEIFSHCNICTLQGETERDVTRGRNGANSVGAALQVFSKKKRDGNYSKETNQDGCILLLK
jgi:hypothetical protein